MSWSVSFIGQPANVAKALQDHSATLDGESKTEYDAALPHLVALVNSNFGEPPSIPPIIQITANGHVWINEGKPQYGNLGISITLLNGTIV